MKFDIEKFKSQDRKNLFSNIPIDASLKHIEKKLNLPVEIKEILFSEETLYYLKRSGINTLKDLQEAELKTINKNYAISAEATINCLHYLSEWVESITDIDIQTLKTEKLLSERAIQELKDSIGISVEEILSSSIC